MPALGQAGAKALTIIRNSQTTDNGGSWWDVLRSTSAAKIDVTQELSLGVVAVYAAVSLIADNCSSLPIRILERGDTTRTPVRPEQFGPLWDKPNNDQTRMTFYEQAFVSLLLWGNSYNYLGWTNGGRLEEMWPIDPARVRMFRDSDKRLRMEIAGYAEGRDALINRVGELPQFMHVPAVTLPGRILGLSPIEYARETIGSALAAEQTSGSMLANGLRLDAVIQAKAKLTPDEAKTLGAQFQQRHSGASGRTVAVIDQDATIQKLAISPQDAQFVEQMKDHVTQVARLYRIAPHLLGDVEKSTSWGTGMEEQNIMFATLTLRPWLIRFEQAVQDTILAGTKYDMRFVLDGLLRGSQKDRYAAYQVGLDSGFESPNTVLEKEDRPPIENGDAYRTPLNFATDELRAAQVLKAQAEAAAALVALGLGAAEAATAAGLPGLEFEAPAPTPALPEPAAVPAVAA